MEIVADIPLEVALEVLYQRHGGAPFHIDLTDWVASHLVEDAVLRALLDGTERTAYVGYATARKQVRKGWRICYQTRPAPNEMFDTMFATLTPPKNGNY